MQYLFEKDEYNSIIKQERKDAERYAIHQVLDNLLEERPSVCQIVKEHCDNSMSGKLLELRKLINKARSNK